MPAAKLCSSESLNAMKSEEGNDSLDTFIKHAIGKEPLIPFTRTADTPVQWIQLLHALDQPELPGWPMLSPAKLPMQKCEKCSREFCSPINYRRHIRVHRRSLNVNKESHKHRDVLAAFWDKISLEQAKELVSFDDVMLKETPGSSVISALESSLHKPGLWTLPPFYSKAGATLLDIIQAKPSRLPISSQELFCILDDASEQTFLCAGTAESVEKYVFDGETAKNCLELKNQVACTSFLFEQLLVKAWMADKDAEALRCQKLLVEEEEAAQKKLAALLEKKKQKKLRQKEQRVKEQFYGHSGDLIVDVDAVNRPTSAEAFMASSPSDSNPNSPDIPTNLVSTQEPMPPQIKESVDIEAQFDNTSSEQIKPVESQSIKSQMVGPDDTRHLAHNRWQAPKSQRGSRAGFNLPPKSEPVHKLGPNKDRNFQTGTKVWAKKLKPDSDGEIGKPSSSQVEASHQMEENNCEPPSSQVEASQQIKEINCEPSSQVEASQQMEENNCEPSSSQVEASHQMEENNCEVFIGSIPITLKNPVAHQQGNRPDENAVLGVQHNRPDENAVLGEQHNRPDQNAVLGDQHNRPDENAVLGDQHNRPDQNAVLQKKNAPEKSTKNQSGNNRVPSKQWRPVRHGETKNITPLDRDKEDSEGGTSSKKVPDRILANEKSELSQTVDDDFDKRKNEHCVLSDENAQEGTLPFSSVAAKEFLAQRWKEAVLSDHVTLVLSEPEPPGSSDVHRESSPVPDVTKPPDNEIGGGVQVKASKKSDKGGKIKYKRKQKGVA